MARTRIEGTNGNDTLNEGPQASSDILGRGGDDRIFLTRDDDLGGDNLVKAGAGDDQVLNRFEGGNEILLGAGNDIYAADGFALSTGIPDLVKGGTGDDTIAVSTFHSAYFGQAGKDTFFSVGWQNSFNGGGSADTIDYSLRDDDATLGGSGVTVDLLAGKAFTGATRTESLVSIENAVGTGFADQIFGSNGKNALDGGKGDDQVAGEGGRDTLKGGDGRDEIDGGAGNDVMIGGRGADLLFGGAGADRFDFDATFESRGGTRDTILDFGDGDRIDLTTMDADTTASGNQTFRFIGSAEFGSDPGEVRFANGVLSGNMDDDAAAEFEIALTNVSTLQADGLIL